MSASVCPYCRLEVHPEAVICPHCHSHLGLIRPLMHRVDELAEQVKALQAQLGTALTPQAPALGTEGPSSGAAAAREADRQAMAEAVEQWATAWPPLPHASIWRQLAGVAATIAALWALHALSLFVYDLPPVIFRLEALLTPMVLGMLFHRGVQLDNIKLSIGALIVAVASVLLMLAMTARVDGTPFWPETTRDWRELLEFTVAIALGYATGVLLARALERRRTHAARVPLMVLLLKKDDKGRYNVEALAERVQSFATATMPLATSALSLYTGLKALIGSA